MINFILLVFNIIIIAIIIFQGKLSEKSSLYSKSIHTSTIAFVKIFPYIAYVPLITYSLSGFNQNDITIKVVSVINCIMFTVFFQLNELSNWAYRFI